MGKWQTSKKINSVNLAIVKPTAQPSAWGPANFAGEEIIRKNSASSKRTTKIRIAQIR